MSQESRGDVAKRSSTVYGIQIMRGMAALAVVLHHASLQVSIRQGNYFIPQGAFGVDVFFIISGFVVFLTGQKLGAGEFLLRRIARVVPLYWFFLAIKVLYMLAGHQMSGYRCDTPSYIASSFLFYPAYRCGEGPLPLITAAWSLNFEMYFYLVFAFFIVVLRKKLLVATTGWITFASLLGLLLWRGGVGHPAAPVVLLCSVSLEFVFGLWLARWWQKGLSCPAWLSCLLIGVAAITVILLPEPDMYGQDRILIWGMPALAMFLGVLALELRVNFSRWRFALLLGDASYALYLSHTAVLPLLDKLVRHLPLPWFAAAAVMTVMCVIIGILVHRLIEKPLVRLVSRGLRLHVKSPLVESVKHGA